jgi:hypothetical protein
MTQSYLDESPAGMIGHWDTKVNDVADKNKNGQVPNKMGGLSVGRSLFHAHFDQSSSPF